MTNTFIPHVASHHQFLIAAARNLYDSSGLTRGKETKKLMIENGRFFIWNTLMPVILKYVTPAGK
jgi:hypothetical protein